MQGRVRVLIGCSSAARESAGTCPVRESTGIDDAANAATHHRLAARKISSALAVRRAVVPAGVGRMADHVVRVSARGGVCLETRAGRCR